MAPSLALLTLANLIPDGHEVIIIDENIEKIDYNHNVDLVGITITLDVLPRAIQIAERFRQGGIPVVAGGVHVTCSPDECLRYFDAICIGAAERVWAQIIEDVSRKKLQQIYHNIDGFRGDEVVPPKYATLNKSRYLYTNIVLTSRGCPNKCSFCYNSSKNRIYVRRPIQDVLKDIDAIKTRHVMFSDDNFIGCPEYTKVLLENLRGKKLKWNTTVTTKIADYPELLDLMSEVGCQSLFIGFESINNVALKGVNKDNRFEKYESIVKEIHSKGIMINASMVFGLDGDNSDVFKNTLDWLVKNKIETLTSHILTPYPGTELYSRMKKEGRIVEFDLSKYNTACVVFEPRGMTAEELYRGYIWMYKEFYSFKNILRRMPEHRAQRVPYILFNIFYRKFGRLTSAIAQIIPMHTLGRMGALISYRI